jgi:transaldolase
MKIYLATASTEDVAWGAAHGMLDGVITSPGLLADDADAEMRTHLAELCRLVHGPIFASVHSVDGVNAYRDGKELAKISDQIVVQLPLVEETLGAMRRLQADGIRVSATQVFNAAQALLAARAGASSVVTPVDRLDAARKIGRSATAKSITLARCALSRRVSMRCERRAVLLDTPPSWGSFRCDADSHAAARVAL